MMTTVPGIGSGEMMRGTVRAECSLLTKHFDHGPFSFIDGFLKIARLWVSRISRISSRCPSRISQHKDARHRRETVRK